MIGVARRSLSNDEFKENVKKSIQSLTDDQEKIYEFISHFYYHSHDVTNSDSYTAFKCDQLRIRSSISDRWKPYFLFSHGT